MLAALFAPEFILDTTSTEFDGKPESKYLAQSIKDVSDHYATKYLDKKTVDILNLGQALLVVYGTRFYSIRERRKSERAQRAKPVQPFQAQQPTQNQRPSEPQSAAPENTTPEQTREPDRRGVIGGVGFVEFPLDHPMVRTNGSG